MLRLRTDHFEYGVVASRPDQMYGWPGITRVKGEEILVACSERKYHVCPFGREVIIRSIDGGRTWGLPQEVYNSELDDRDSSLVTMPDGTIILTFFTSDAFTIKGYLLRPEWQARTDRITQKMRDELLGGWLLRSFDGGKTWETAPHRIPSGAHSGPSVLSDGSLICTGDAKSSDGYKKAVFSSGDTGLTWNQIGEIPCPRVKKGEKGLLTPAIDEYSVLELTPGKLLAMFRRDAPGFGFMYQSNSEDNGRTWQEAKELPIWGFPPHLIRLKSGAILCSYSHRKEPWSIRAVISYDDGRTWDTDNIITLCQWDDKPDMGYPVSLEVEPGQILTVFYCSREDSIHIRHEEKVKGSTPEGLLYTRFTLS